MGRKRKTLADLVRAGTFEARRTAHRDLLANDAPPADEKLAELQAKFKRARSEAARKDIASEFERLVRDREPQTVREDLEALVADLGAPGSAERIINLFPRFFRLEDDSPWHLDEWQKDFLREAHRFEGGKRVFREIWLGIPRGNAKTPLASGHGLDSLLPPWGAHHPLVIQVAGSAEQARIGTDYAKFWVQGTEEAPGPLNPYIETRSSSLHLEEGEFRVLSSDGRLGHGRKPTVGIVDEAWLLQTFRERQSVIALQTALFKVPYSYILGISTAGYDLTSLLGEVYTAAMQLDVEKRGDFLRIARDEASGFLLWWYSAPEDLDPTEMSRDELLWAVRGANPGSWVDHEAIVDSFGRPGADVLELRRLHLNQWTVVKGAWLPTGCWRGLEAPELEIPDGAPVYVGIDAAHSFDTTAVAWAWQNPEGRVVVRSRVWSVRREAPADVYLDGATTLDNEAHVEPFVRALGDKYDVQEVAYDPRYFQSEARHLEDRFVVAEVTPSSSEMRTLVSEFYKMATGGRVAHAGRTASGRVLEAHVNATAGQKTPQGWRIEKLWPPAHPIDATVAAIIAAGRCSLLAGADGFFIY